MQIKGTDAFDKWQEYGIDFKVRRVVLDDGIDDIPTVNRTLANLLWLDKTAEGPIEFWINCPGGYISSMWAIHDLMRTASNPIITVGLGDVASAAVLLLAAGTGTRYVTANTQLMHHQPEHDRPSNETELQDYAAQSAKDEERRLRALAKYTKRPYRWWKSQAGREFYAVGQEIIDLGLADELYTGPLDEDPHE